MSHITIQLSAIDEERFGVRTARATDITLEDLPAVRAFCQQHAVQLLIARVAVQHLNAVQAMEADGFRLMDTLVYYAFQYAKKAIPEQNTPYMLRPVTPGDVEAVRQIALHSFEGYFGHYHADPRLDNQDCDAVYTDWAKTSAASREVADEVYVVQSDEGLLGFATLRMNRAEEGEGVLFGVAPQAQGRGIYRAMMIQGLQWCQQQGATRMVVSTQITNVAVQKVWARVGFEFDHAYYTLHKWFD